MNGGPKVLVTGANGCLGSALCERFRIAGWDVRRGVREPENNDEFRCNLPSWLDFDAFEGARAVIHCAYTTRHLPKVELLHANVGGTVEVLRAARRAGVEQFVFVSSCSAHAAARSLYGRSKYYLEGKLKSQRGDLVVRPGLIVADGGLFGRMAATVRNAAILPLFDGGRQIVQTVALDEIAEAILRAVDARRTDRLVLANPRALTMRGLLETIARAQGREPRFLFLPGELARMGFQTTEALGLKLPVTSENLLGLLGAAYQDPAGAWSSLGIEPSGPESSIEAACARMDDSGTAP